MSVVTRCGAVSLVLGLLVGVTPVRAQTAPADASASSWSDPPVRGSTGPESSDPVKPGVAAPAAAEKPAPPEAARPAQSADAPPATPARRAASALGVKPVEPGRSSVAATSPPQTRRPAVRPRMVERPLVIARQPARIVERPSRRLTQRASGRSIRSYAFASEGLSYDRVDPYDGRGYSLGGSNRRLAGWGGLVEENRASRIARARESGYAVMRMRTYAYPDGTQVQRLTPLDGGAFGDLD